MTKQPSKERGCNGKANLGKDYKKSADKLALKHDKQYGVYKCPHCNGTHVTTKLENSHLYADFLYVTSNG